MHEGCRGFFENGAQTVNKVRMMGFAEQLMPMPFEMSTFKDRCPYCNMVYGLVPCHAFNPDNIQAAGIDY